MGDHDKRDVVVMRHDWTIRRQANASVARAETIDESEGEILFLDEHHLTRDCIGRELARRLPEFKIIERAMAELSAGDPALAKIALIILHVHADRMDLHARREDPDQKCIAAQLSILEKIAPDTPRVLMSEIEVPEEILEAFRRRVRGYVPTTLPIKQVVEAIRFIAAGGTFVPPSILSMQSRARMDDEEPHDAPISDELSEFSPRQNEVLRMLWNGSSNKVIAYELRMSESTVKVHIRHIMKKLNVNNRTQVVLRTRPERLDRIVPSTRLGSPTALQAAKAIVSLAENRAIPGHNTTSPLNPSSEVGARDNPRGS